MKRNATEKFALSPLGLLMPWALLRLFTERAFVSGRDRFKVSEIETWRSRLVSDKHGVKLILRDEGPTFRGLATGLVPFIVLYWVACLVARREVTWLNNDGSRCADFRLFRLDRDYLLGISTEPMVSYGLGCMALSEMADLAREGAKHRSERNRAAA